MKQTHQFLDETSVRYDSSDLHSNGTQIFDREDLILALDRLLQEKILKHKGLDSFRFDRLKINIKPNKTLHLSIVGDSRMRQLFILFLAVRIVQL